MVCTHITVCTSSDYYVFLIAGRGSKYYYLCRLLKCLNKLPIVTHKLDTSSILYAN